MARRWGGFLPQNLTAKEEWELVASCEAQARPDRREVPEPAQAEHKLSREQKRAVAVRVVKSKT